MGMVFWGPCWLRIFDGVERCGCRSINKGAIDLTAFYPLLSVRRGHLDIAYLLSLVLWIGRRYTADVGDGGVKLGGDEHFEGDATKYLRFFSSRH